MNNDIIHKVLDLYDQAMADPEYMALHAEYAPAQLALAELLSRLPEADRQILEEYLRTSVALFHRLLEMALAEQ